MGLWLVVSLRWLQSREDLRASLLREEADERTPLMREAQQQPASAPKASAPSTATATKQPASRDVLEVQAVFAGKLAFALPATASQDKASYTIAIDGVPAPAEAIYLKASATGVLVTLDILQANKLMTDGSRPVERSWAVQFGAI